jgi:outer membrane PBP1 activator LpoA protein
MLSLNKFLIAVFCSALLLAGCGSPISTLSRDNVRVAGSAEEQRAARLARKGDYSAAAYLYERIAKKQSGEKRIKSLLTAADYYLLAGDDRSARRIMTSLGPLDAALYPLHPVLQAELLLKDGKTQAALAALGSAPSAGDSHVSYRFYSTLARIQMARNADRAALDAMLKLDGMNISRPHRLANQRAIIALLAGMQPGERQKLMGDGSRTLAGWATLADILNHSASLSDRDVRLASWKSSFRSHPAMKELYEGGDLPELTGGTIAVMLPLSGRYAKAAGAIRTGIEVTGSQLPPDRQPAMTFVDSTDLASALQQAQGANMLIGPLTKESVQQVVSGGGTGKTTITLNQVSEYSPSGTYQFGLSTVAEGALIADKAYSDGLRNAAVIYPGSSWGVRYLQGFQKQFESLGGTLAGVTSYDQGEKDLSARMKNLMQSNPDMVLIVAKPVTARQIRQQVRYHGSAQTAVYATSTSYDRRLYGVQDKDFDNVKLPVLRWTLPGQDAPGVPSWDAVQSAGNFDPGLAKFYALGIDALLLAVNSGKLGSGGTVQGATGDLDFSNTGIVERRMIWIHYQDGVPVPIAY